MLTRSQPGAQAVIEGLALHQSKGEGLVFTVLSTVLEAVATHTPAVAAAPDYDPSGSSAPGRAVAQELLNTVAFFCSVIALAAFAMGAAMWGIGGRIMHSSHGAAMGKMTMLAAVGGSILLGAGPAIIAWAMALGARA